MDYILCHKNIPVLNLVMNEYNDFVKINEIYCAERIPVGLINENKSVNLNQNFKDWWEMRGIPASRTNLTQALEVLGNITTKTLLNKCLGASLSDHYWIKPENSNLRWEDINFFQNDFSDDVGKALFGNLDTANLSKISLVSPNSTSDGCLRKKWYIDNNQRYLLKSGSSPFAQEVFNEVLASEICKRLNIDHVEYKAAQLKSGHFVSICPDFIGENTELIPAWNVRDSFNKNKNDNPYKHLITCCKKLGMQQIDDIEKSLCNMIVLDYIIANTDRHYSNFGFIRNPDTLEWKGVAPIYDSGTSMYTDVYLGRLKQGDCQNLYDVPARTFGKNHHEQIKRLPIDTYCSNMNMNALSDIGSYYHKLLSLNIEFNDERKTILSERLQKNVQSIKKEIKRQKTRTRENEYSFDR